MHSANWDVCPVQRRLEAGGRGLINALGTPDDQEELRDRSAFASAGRRGKCSAGVTKGRKRTSLWVEEATNHGPVVMMCPLPELVGFVRKPLARPREFGPGLKGKTLDAVRSGLLDDPLPDDKRLRERQLWRRTATAR